MVFMGSICQIWAILKGSVEIIREFKISAH
jgi:hypothetical protein